MKKLAFVVCLVLARGVAADAKVYRQVQPDGSVEFTDQRPTGDAEEIKVPPVQTFRAPPSQAAETRQDRAEHRFQGYEAFAVVRPANDETIRDNNGVVPVQLSLEPPLRSGDKVELMMDGQVLGSGRSLSITLQQVDRGAHSVEARIVDEHGKELTRTAAINFYLQRVSKLLP